MRCSAAHQSAMLRKGRGAGPSREARWGGVGVTPLLFGHREVRMGRAGWVQVGMNLGMDGRGLGALSIAVQINLLAGCNSNVVAGATEPMKEVDALVVDAQK